MADYNGQYAGAEIDSLLNKAGIAYSEFTEYANGSEYARISGKVVNVEASTTTASVQYKGSGNGDTYRVVTTGSTALKSIAGVSIKCPTFVVTNDAIEQVMFVEFKTSTSDFSFALTNSSGATVTTIPWVDKVSPVWTTDTIYTVAISRAGVSVSSRVASNLYGE